jgi:hypothetical protein
VGWVMGGAGGVGAAFVEAIVEAAILLGSLYCSTLAIDNSSSRMPHTLSRSLSRCQKRCMKTCVLPASLKSSSADGA